MILALDISTSITGATIIKKNGEVVLCESWRFDNKKKFPNLFDKAQETKKRIDNIFTSFLIDEVWIESSLHTFSSGKSSAQTLSILSKFNGIISWMVYEKLKKPPFYIPATSARKNAGLTIKKGEKAKEKVMEHMLNNEKWFEVEYTKFGIIKKEYYDMADSFIVAKAGLANWLMRKKNLKS